MDPLYTTTPPIGSAYEGPRVVRKQDRNCGAEIVALLGPLILAAHRAAVRHA